MSDLDRYERMAQRTREREASRRIREQVELRRRAVECGGAPDALPGEGQLLDHDEHFGHRTHINFLVHGNSVVCSCGVHVGCFSFIPPTEGEYAEMRAAQPDGCLVCQARGLSQ